jgi:LmbE family N-acetylglucosaminyl deacetylase
MALRRAEDTASLTLLGAEAQHLDYPDAVYRATVGGEWLYTNLETLFGKVHPGDPVTAAALAERVTGAVPREPHLTVYAPLAAGRHVDHQIVHQAARQLLDQGYRLAFYEDYPYAERPGAVEVALAAAGADNWHSESLALSAADLAAKVAALGYCRSQMAILFGGAEAMPNRVWAFAASRTTGGGLAERLWWL